MNKDKVTDISRLPKRKCGITYAVDIVGGKWRIPIIWCLFNNKTLRYSEIKKSLNGITNNGITNTVLIKCLKELEEYNLIKRKQYNEVPPRVEYSLTEGGKALLPTLKELNIWGEKQIEINSKINHE